MCDGGILFRGTVIVGHLIEVTLTLTPTLFIFLLEGFRRIMFAEGDKGGGAFLLFVTLFGASC